MKRSGLEKLRSTELAVGTWLSSGSPVVAELAAHCGLDWLLFDLEHGCLTEAELLANLRAVSGGNAGRVVRVPDHDPARIGRVLDWGAEGIMVPHVETAEAATGLARAMAYPPRGMRGYSRTVRAYGFGLTDPEPAAVLWLQIETVEAVRNVEEIAAVEDIHGLFVGPADLRLSLSGETAFAFEEALDRVAAAARRRNLAAGILIRNPEELSAMRERGFSKVAIDSDLVILRAGFQRIVG